MKRIAAFLVLGTFCYCSSRPVLYENSKYNAVGERNAQIDIDQCMRGAGQSNDGASMGGIGTQAMRGGVRGGCSGLFSLDPIGGAASGIMGGVESGSVDYADKKVMGSVEGESEEAAVERCLAQKGYQVAGWE